MKLNEKLSNILGSLEFEPNEKQVAFLDHFINRSSGHSVLQGIAGAGKSTMLSILKKYYGDEIVFFGSTGISSQNMPDGIGMGTTHSGLSLSMKPATEINYKKVFPKCSELFATSDLIKIIVIDEAYIHNSDNLDLIWRRIVRFNKRTSKRKSRDIRLLLVGDSCQATTIVSDEDIRKELHKRWGHHLMFKSTVWDRFNFTYYVLDKVERQEDPIYKACLDVIRYNQLHRFHNCLTWLNKRVDYDYDQGQMILAATNKTVDLINNGVLKKNPNQKFSFKPRISGDFNIKDTIVRDQGVTVCKDLKVMTIVNDPYGSYQNGSTGMVTQASNDGCYIKMDHSGEEVWIELHKWENKEAYVENNVVQQDGTAKDELRERVAGTMHCLPVLQCSAISIMKAQGLTIREKYVLDLEKTWLYTWEKMEDFGQNFLYLGLSRGTDIENLTLASHIEIDHIKVCQDSIDFWHECCEKSVI